MPPGAPSPGGSRWWWPAALALGVIVGACSGSPALTGDPAPEFPTGVEWLNATEPVTLAGLEGKVVLPFFWTSSCIGCVEELGDLERLQAEFPDELVVLGIHSGKFPTEKNGEAVAQAVVRHDIGYPVVNDPGFEIWEDWEVTAWPTAAVVNPEGRLVDRHRGAGLYAALQPIVRELVDSFDELDTTIRVFPTAQAEEAPTVLRYPGSVLADPDGGRLFIADTGHNRIVIADLASGEVQTVIGSGASGRADGPFGTATFDEPRGLAIDPTGTTLYVADAGSHLIRAVGLTTTDVVTVAGTGDRAIGIVEPGAALETPLNEPYDLELDNGQLYIAMAGANQVWYLDIAAALVKPVAGSGREGVSNGDAAAAELAAPTGVAMDATAQLFIADSGSSSIRIVTDAQGDPQVVHHAGGDSDLFQFGDRDGLGPEARFQRPLGVTAGDGGAWVADTYNSKIKRVGTNGDVLTVAGSVAGWRDGADPLFSQPEGLDFVEGGLYVADTGNHSIRYLDLLSGQATTFVLKGIELLVPDTGDFTGTAVTLEPVEVGPGPGRVVLNVSYPPGYKANEEAPSRFNWTVEGGAAVLAPTAGGSVVGPAFPIEIDATFAEGEGVVRADLWLVYCDVDAQSICLFDRARIEVPLLVGGSAPSEVALDYQVTLAEGLR